MNKEAQDFSWIQTSRAQYFLCCLEMGDLESEGILQQLGYRKLPKDKPPLLTEGEAYDLSRFDLVVAQREADIKFYSEVE